MSHEGLLSYLLIIYLRGGGACQNMRVAMFRLAEPEARRLADMPSMRCFGPRGMNPYILPPILYPDGHVWLTLGSDPIDVELHGESDIKGWFRSGGSTRMADGLQAQILDRIRDLRFEERRVVPCMTTFGDSGMSQIGPLTLRDENSRSWVGYGGVGSVLRQYEAPLEFRVASFIRENFM